MRHFIYFSASAPTSGKFNTDDLMSAGRLDIAIHSIINAIFLSHDIRDDVIIHLIFYGMPDPPKHVEIRAGEGLEISKKNVAGIIKKILYKYKEGEKTEVFPGCYVEKKSFLNVVENLREEGNEIFILDKRGSSIRKTKLPNNSAFIIGDQNGFPQKEFKRLKKSTIPISVGPKMYFASSVVTIINNELDNRE